MEDHLSLAPVVSLSLLRCTAGRGLARTRSSAPVQTNLKWESTRQSKFGKTLDCDLNNDHASAFGPCIYHISLKRNLPLKGLVLQLKLIASCFLAKVSLYLDWPNSHTGHPVLLQINLSKFWISNLGTTLYHCNLTKVWQNPFLLSCLKLSQRICKLEKRKVYISPY